jgi:hypothetical protein
MKEEKEKAIKIRDTGDNNSEEVIVTRSPSEDQEKRAMENMEKKSVKP